MSIYVCLNWTDANCSSFKKVPDNHNPQPPLDYGRLQVCLVRNWYLFCWNWLRWKNSVLSLTKNLDMPRDIIHPTTVRHPMLIKTSAFSHQWCNTPSSATLALTGVLRPVRLTLALTPASSGLTKFLYFLSGLNLVELHAHFRYDASMWPNVGLARGCATSGTGARGGCEERLSGGRRETVCYCRLARVQLLCIKHAPWYSYCNIDTDFSSKSSCAL